MAALAEALELAALGFRVFPLWPNGKTPVIGKNDPAYGNRGCLDATADPDQIARWWARYPNANIGIATGRLADDTLFAVIDLDEHNPTESGNEAWAELTGRHGPVDTVEALTATGEGRHLYVLVSAPVTNAAGRNFPAGIDVRGDGGYVVAPPSITKDGSYQWESSTDPTDGAYMAVAPDWLDEKLTVLPEADRVKPPPRDPALGPDLRPGTRWMAATTWDDLLGRDGAKFIDWHTASDGSGYETWARPGCEADHGELHTGATLYYLGSDVLKVHTSAWPRLEAGQTYDKLGYIAATVHGGSLEAATAWVKNEERTREMAEAARAAALLGNPATLYGADMTSVDRAALTATIDLLELDPAPADGPLPEIAAVDEAPPAPPIDPPAPPTDNDEPVEPGPPWEPTPVSVNEGSQADFMRWTRQAWDAYNHPGCTAPHRDGNPVVYERAGEFVRIVVDAKGFPIVQTVDAERWRAEAKDGIAFMKVTPAKDENGVRKNLYTPAWLPIERAKAFLSDRDPMRRYPLAGIVPAPAMRPDGTFHTDQGYDPATEAYVWGHYTAAPPAPTPLELAAAVAAVDDIIGEFPFADPLADRANAFALLLTPIIRSAISGHVPMALINAHNAGTGKTLLSSVAGALALGQRTTTASTLPEDENEVSKVITTRLLAGDSVMVFENVTHPLGESDALTAVLTQDFWGARRLGTNDQLRLPNRATWIATGNNLQIVGDFARRCYMIHLDAKGENPETRQPSPAGFKHADLVNHVVTPAVRDALLVALMTLVRGWVTAGRPRGARTKGGTMDEWSRMIGGILDVAGVEGFLANDAEFRSEADIEAREWADFYGELARAFKGSKFTVAEILELTDPESEYLRDADLAESVPGFAARMRPNTARMKNALSKAMVKRHGRYDGGWVLTKLDIRTANRTHFIVSRTGVVPVEGESSLDATVTASEPAPPAPPMRDVLQGAPELF